MKQQGYITADEYAAGIADAAGGHPARHRR